MSELVVNRTLDFLLRIGRDSFIDEALPYTRVTIRVLKGNGLIESDRGYRLTAKGKELYDSILRFFGTEVDLYKGV